MYRAISLYKHKTVECTTGTIVEVINSDLANQVILVKLPDGTVYGMCDMNDFIPLDNPFYDDILQMAVINGNV